MCIGEHDGTTYQNIIYQKLLCVNTTIDEKTIELKMCSNKNKRSCTLQTKISDLQIRDSLAVLEALLVKYTVSNLEICDLYKIIDPLTFFC